MKEQRKSLFLNLVSKRVFGSGILFHELAANVLCSVAWDIRHCAGGQRTTDLGAANQRPVLADYGLRFDLCCCNWTRFPASWLLSFPSGVFLSANGMQRRIGFLASLQNFGSEIFCSIMNEEWGLGEHGFSQRSIAGDWRR